MVSDPLTSNIMIFMIVLKIDHSESFILAFKNGFGPYIWEIYFLYTKVEFLWLCFYCQVRMEKQANKFLNKIMHSIYTLR